MITAAAADGSAADYDGDSGGCGYNDDGDDDGCGGCGGHCDARPGAKCDRPSCDKRSCAWRPADWLSYCWLGFAAAKRTGAECS